MYWNYKEKLSWDLQLCPCREIDLILESPLLEIPLHKDANTKGTLLVTHDVL